MQFARELSKGFGGARPARNDSTRPARDAKPQNFGEKFGSPRPQRSSNRTSNSAPAGERAPRRPQSDGTRRSRSFA